MRSPTIEKLSVSSKPGARNLATGTVALSDTGFRGVDEMVSGPPSNNWANTINTMPLNENSTLLLLKLFKLNIYTGE